MRNQPLPCFPPSLSGIHLLLSSCMSLHDIGKRVPAWARKAIFWNRAPGLAPENEIPHRGHHVAGDQVGQVLFEGIDQEAVFADFRVFDASAIQVGADIDTE